MGKDMCKNRRMVELLEGRPSERMSLTLTPRLKDAATELAQRRGQTMCQLVRHLLAKEAAEARETRRLAGPQEAEG